MKRILIVDDEPAICWSLGKLFQSEGFHVATASSAEKGLQLAEVDKPDVVLLDIRLPGASGLDSVASFGRLLGSVPIILMTAYCDLDTAIRALDLKVAEYLPKPFDTDRVLEVVKNALQLRAAAGSEPDRAPTNGRALRMTPLLGRSAAMQEVFRKVAFAASSDVPVLITGESGTGKELVARAIHANSGRRDEVFYPIALPALNEELMESELFGHRKGAFTGAIEDRDGLFTLANRGTILLDEIGELPLHQQVKLLRVLESGEFFCLGDLRPRKSNARVLAATNQDMAACVKAGTFREDLYFRLAVFEIKLPPLRDRMDDLPILCNHLLGILGYPNPENAMTADAWEELEGRAWRGNVRELRNAIEHAVLMARGGAIKREHIPPSQSWAAATGTSSLSEMVGEWADEQLQNRTSVQSDVPGILEKFISEVEPILIQKALKASEGNQVLAAQLLGIHRSTLREKLNRAAQK